MSYEKIFSKLPSGWEIGTLDQYAEVIDPHPSHRAPAEVLGGYPFLGIGDLDYFGNATFDAARHVGLDIIEEHERNYLISETSIGYAKMGNTIGKVVSFPNRKGKTRFAVSPALSIINPNEQIHPYYLRAVVESAAFWGQVNGKITGSTRPSIGIQQLRKILIPIPPETEQVRIGELWKVLYDKINVNNAINDNLQQQAMALYASMFLDNPALETTAGTLKDIADITMGQSPSGSSYNENGNGEVFYQGRAEFGYRFPTRRLYTTEPKRMAEAGDVLLSVRAPVGDLNVAYERCCIGRGLGAIHGRNGYQSFVLYTMFALRPQLDVYNGEGTVFGSINRNALNDMPIDIPSEDAIAAFEAVARPMDDMIRSNYEENCRLQELRDSLLPRLMSGEVDISSIDI